MPLGWGRWQYSGKSAGDQTNAVITQEPVSFTGAIAELRRPSPEDRVQVMLSVGRRLGVPLCDNQNIILRQANRSLKGLSEEVFSMKRKF